MDAEIHLLGEFSVSVDGTAVPEGAWSRRQAAALVKLLALAPGRRLLRDQVFEALWPDAGATAAPRLHKAAHYARRALGGDESSSVVLRDDLVCLLPTARVSVDVDRFRAAASAALAARSPERAAEALALWPGPLLPTDVYEAWTAQDRADLDLLHRSLLDVAGRWEELVRLDPTDEAAHLHLVREHERRGDVRAALRQFERLDQALRHELGTTPSPEAEEVRRRLLAVRPPQPPPPNPPGGSRRLVGRRDTGDVLRRVFGEASAGRGRTVVVSGAPGIGKSAVLDLAASLASRRGWRTGRGTASAIEGLWPYAPVLEALADLCRQHPVLLDGLDDRFREEIDRALSGDEMSARDGNVAHQRLFVAAAELVRLAAAGHGLLLVVDDVHEADEASLRLLHYLSRAIASERVVIGAAGRPGRAALEELRAGLATRGLGERIDLAPLSEDADLRLIADRYPGLDRTRALGIHAASGGVPFLTLELARSAVEGAAPVVDVRLSPEARRTFQRMALLGMSFSTDELLAVADTPVDDAYVQLDEALAAFTVEPAETGYRFRHALVREGLTAAMPASERRAAHHDLAVRLATLPGATPGRIAHHYLAAGEPREAVPYVLPFVRTAGALGAYRDALTLVDAVLDHAGAEDRAHLLARRGDLLLALGDPEAISAYRDAVPETVGTEHRLVRARLARAASFTGDLEVARGALEGLELEGDEADGQVLLARGAFAYVNGDVDGAVRASSTARDLLSPADLAQVGRPRRAPGPDRPPARGVVRAVPARAAADAGQAGDGGRPVRRAPLRRRVRALRPDAVRRGGGARPRTAPALGAGRRPARRRLRHRAHRRGGAAQG